MSNATSAVVAAVLAHYPSISPAAVGPLTDSRDGLAVALLLLKAAAKGDVALYQHQMTLLAEMVELSHPADWWAVAHTHPEATSYKDTVAVFVETTIGPVLDITRVQLSVHIGTADAVALGPAPDALGRHWAGVPLQHRAEAIAAAWLEGVKY